MFCTTDVQYTRLIPLCVSLRIIQLDLVKLHLREKKSPSPSAATQTLTLINAHYDMFVSIFGRRDYHSVVCSTPYAPTQLIVVVEVANLVIMFNSELSEMLFDIMQTLENQCTQSCIKSLPKCGF